jgi:hypothetical protein
MRRLLLAIVLTAALISGPAATPVLACPMCAEANKADENRPKAYMYSILFMMSMPAIIFTGFGIGLYRLHRKHAAVETDPFEDD